MRYVWPRLPVRAARQILGEIAVSDAITLRRTATTSHPEAAPVAVGGRQVAEAVIVSLQSHVRTLADGLGFPVELQGPSVSTFDQPATRMIHDLMGIIPADAASDDVWNFVTLVLLPDVAVWRFPGRKDERLLGRPRNVFRRLWWRAETLGPDVIDAPRGLGEDELVNIMERPTLAANPRTARMLAELIVERGDQSGVARSELMRDVSKRVLRHQAVVCMDALNDSLIQGVLDDCFAEAAASLNAAKG